MDIRLFKEKYKYILNNNGISKYDVLELEKIVGTNIITNKLPLYKFTDDISSVNYESAMDILNNTLQEHTNNVENNVKKKYVDNIKSSLNILADYKYNVVGKLKSEIVDILTDPERRYVYNKNNELINVADLTIHDVLSDYPGLATDLGLNALHEEFEDKNESSINYSAHSSFITIPYINFLNYISNINDDTDWSRVEKMINYLKADLAFTSPTTLRIILGINIGGNPNVAEHNIDLLINLGLTTKKDYVDWGHTLRDNDFGWVFEKIYNIEHYSDTEDDIRQSIFEILYKK